VVSPADCRCVVFERVSSAREFWIKGEKFNIPDLLQDKETVHYSLTKEKRKGI